MYKNIQQPLRYSPIDNFIYPVTLILLRFVENVKSVKSIEYSLEFVRVALFVNLLKVIRATWSKELIFG